MKGRRTGGNILIGKGGKHWKVNKENRRKGQDEPDTDFNVQRKTSI